MNQDHEILNRIIEVLNDLIEIDGELTLETRLEEDLEFDSMDLLSLELDLEEEFDLLFTVLDLDDCKTLQDVVNEIKKAT